MDVDLWNFVTPNGKSLKKGFLWLLPYAEGTTWQYTQIKPIDLANFDKLSEIASIKYPEIEISYNVTDDNNDFLYKLMR